MVIHIVATIDLSPKKMANRRIIDAVLSSSDNEDFFVHRRPKFVRRRLDHFEEFDNIAFPARFRLSKESVYEVLQHIRHELEHRREQNHVISPMNQLLLTLRFYATGTHLISAGDFSGVSKTSAHRIVHKVTAAIA
ncbi:uncharacterized protein LOC112494277 [Cephus cinctus]|uniref:Uncharacterized protein LOC112494277 n=1 Tax=Cephus cinctus TaxID=211228 RepID=A0AAJ7RG38_CEPCN|nr:uncharacterized protein LOC112494277 [Cephus cinctus]